MDEFSFRYNSAPRSTVYEVVCKNAGIRLKHSLALIYDYNVQTFISRSEEIKINGVPTPSRTINVIFLSSLIIVLFSVQKVKKERKKERKNECK